MKHIEVQRVAFREKVNAYLVGTYSAEGIERWWRRIRITLGGISPLEALEEDGFDPEDVISQEILHLAKSLAGPGDAT